MNENFDGYTTRMCRVYDGYTPVEFRGVGLAFSTTERDDSPRWTEIRIFRVEEEDDNKYVIATSGCSVVYHRSNASCNTGTPTLGQDLSLDAEPCWKCRPDPREHVIPNKTYDMEFDRHSMLLVGAEDVAESLTLKQPDGSRFMSHVATRALYAAMEHDDHLRQSTQTVRRIV